MTVDTALDDLEGFDLFLAPDPTNVLTKPYPCGLCSEVPRGVTGRKHHGQRHVRQGEAIELMRIDPHRRSAPEGWLFLPVADNAGISRALVIGYVLVPSPVKPRRKPVRKRRKQAPTDQPELDLDGLLADEPHTEELPDPEAVVEKDSEPTVELSTDPEILVDARVDQLPEFHQVVARIATIAATDARLLRHVHDTLDLLDGLLAARSVGPRLGYRISIGALASPETEEA